jgi:predicted ATPase
VDLPERQHTLRATVEWSVGLLEDPERSLLETVAVFVDGWTVEAAARVAGLDEDRALEETEDPFLHAVSELTIAGISAAVGDFEGALREALASLEELHRQDEPFWTAWPPPPPASRRWSRAATTMPCAT